MTQRSVFSSAVAVGVARAFSLLCAAIQLPLLTRILAPAEYSIVAVAIAVATYFSLVVAEPTVLSFQRFPGTDFSRGNYSFALGRVLLLTLFVALLVGAVGALAREFEIAIATVGWGFGIIATRLVSTAWLMWQKPWKYACNLVVVTAVRTGAIVYLTVAGVDVAIAVAITGFITGCVALLISPRTPFSLRPPVHPWTWIFGIHLGLASLAVTVMANSSLLIVSAFSPANGAGQYAAMLQIVTYSTGALLGMLLTVAYPSLRRAWDAGETRAVKRRLSNLTIACLGLAALSNAILCAGNYWLVSAVVGEAFVLPGALSVLLIGSAIGPMGTLASWSHQFELRVERVNTRAWIGAIVGMLAATTGVLAFQAVGAAAGYALGYFAYYIAQSRESSDSPALKYVLFFLICGEICASLVGNADTWIVQLVISCSVATGVLVCLWLRRGRTYA